MSRTMSILRKKILSSGQTIRFLLSPMFVVMLFQCIMGRHFNLTDYLERQFGPQNWVQHSSIISRDVAYLPEDDYDSEDEREVAEKIGEVRENILERNDRNLRPEYRNLCETRGRKVLLNDDDYEYQPPYYHEIYCKSYSTIDHAARNSQKPPKQLCAHPGFHCVQRSRIVSLVRRKWTDTCWEAVAKEIASGCDCMWPVSSLGDIIAHYR